MTVLAVTRCEGAPHSSVERDVQAAKMWQYNWNQGRPSMTADSVFVP